MNATEDIERGDGIEKNQSCIIWGEKTTNESHCPFSSIA